MDELPFPDNEVQAIGFHWCCGGTILYRFYGTLSAVEKDLKYYIESYNSGAFLFAILNGPQENNYGKLFRKLGFENVKQGHNYGYAYPALNVYIYTFKPVKENIDVG